MSWRTLGSENPFQRERRASSSKTRTSKKEKKRQTLGEFLMAAPSKGKRRVRNGELCDSSCIEREGAAGEYPLQGPGCWSAGRDKVYQILVSKVYYLKKQQRRSVCVPWTEMNISPFSLSFFPLQIYTELFCSQAFYTVSPSKSLLNVVVVLS